MRKPFKMVLALIIVLGIGFWLVAYRLGPYGIITPYRDETDLHPGDLHLNFDSLNIHTFDNLTLKGYRIRSNQERPKAVIVFLHGVGSIKECFLDLAAHLSTLGYESILYDSRAHGQSEGIYCTYGFYEKKDVHRIVQRVRTDYGNIKIGLWGKSMGGAVSIQSMAQNSMIDFAIIESAFAEFRTIVKDYQKRIMGVKIPWLANIALDQAAGIAQFHPEQVSPLKSITTINKPILLIHGNQDPKVNVKYSEQLFEAATSQNKQLYIVNGANHDNVDQIGGSTYRERVLNFLEKWANSSN